MNRLQSVLSRLACGCRPLLIQTLVSASAKAKEETNTTILTKRPVGRPVSVLKGPDSATRWPTNRPNAIVS